MYTDSQWGKSLDILQRSMSVNLLRQEVIADNIANVDTPHFKKSTINFETELSAALASENRSKLPLKLSSEGHISNQDPEDYREVLPRRVLDWNGTVKPNGNNVDIEQETNRFVEAQLMYNLMTSAVNQQFQAVNLVLRR